MSDEKFSYIFGILVGVGLAFVLFDPAYKETKEENQELREAVERYAHIFRNLPAKPCNCKKAKAGKRVKRGKA
jgi:hypothetical protein